MSKLFTLMCVAAIAVAGSADDSRGYWVTENGIRKFKIGRNPALSAEIAKRAYDAEAVDRVYHVDESMSLAEVNALDLKPGAKVLFKRGGVWRGQLWPASGKPGAPVVYGAYGEGPKPVIEPSHDLSAPADWTSCGDGLWKARPVGAIADIGNIVFNHGVKGGDNPYGCAFKKQFPDQLKDDLDFCCDQKTFDVVLKSARNPGERFSSVELCEKMHAIAESGMHDVVYDGLWLRYTAAHGIGGDRTKRITIRNCDICWIGGGYLYFDNDGRGVRYGNGIEFWGAAEGHSIVSNRLWEVYDAALTNQSSGDRDVQKDISYIGNEVWNSEYSYEYWQQGRDTVTENILVKGNRFRDAGKGWGHRQRWNPNAAHLMFYDVTAKTKNFVIEGNRFERSEDTVFRLFNDWRYALTVRDNIWETGRGSLCRYHGRPTEKLKYRYPDRLDQIHDDNQAEIESQGTGARVFRAGDEKSFESFLSAGKQR